MMLKKEVTLSIPISDIQSVEIFPDLLNYVITIETTSDKIKLTAQQKELRDFRSAGTLSHDLKGSWHKENFDATLEALTN